MNQDRIIDKEIHRRGEGVYLGASAGRKTGSQGAYPGKIFHDHTLQIVGKRPIFGEFAIKQAQDHD